VAECVAHFAQKVRVLGDEDEAAPLRLGEDLGILGQPGQANISKLIHGWEADSEQFTLRAKFTPRSSRNRQSGGIRALTLYALRGEAQGNAYMLLGYTIILP
jgi:hypothetical protein